MSHNNAEPIIAQEVSPRKVSPDELSDGFRQLGISAGDSVMLHASLDRIGDVDGGAAMVLHRLLGAIGKKGTLLMPTFTSITRHSGTHDNFTKPGCWCEGSETRHLPFIPDLQPDKTIGAIAHRLCSWPSSRRSNHPAFSFVAVGAGGDELVREYDLLDPLLPIRRFLKHDPIVLTVGVLLDSVTAIHLAEEKKTCSKFVMERALTISSKGPAWVDVLALGCSKGFERLRSSMQDVEHKETTIGSAEAQTFSMKRIVETAQAHLDKDPCALSCANTACLNCLRSV